MTELFEGASRELLGTNLGFGFSRNLISLLEVSEDDLNIHNIIW